LALDAVCRAKPPIILSLPSCNFCSSILLLYGTLQSATVQLETFGRELVGYKDKLLNYRLAMLEIQDASPARTRFKEITHWAKIGFC
jgi:hypothetical protein